MSLTGIRRYWPFGVAFLMLLIAGSIRYMRVQQAQKRVSLPITRAPSPTATSVPTMTATPTATLSPTPRPLLVRIAEGLPQRYREPATNVLASLGSVQIGSRAHPIKLATAGMQSSVTLTLRPLTEALAARVYSDERSVYLLAERHYAVVAPFQALRDDISLVELQARWAGEAIAPLYAVPMAVEELTPVLGVFGGEVVKTEALLERLLAQPEALGILPFDGLDPTYKVLTVEGVNVLSNQLDAVNYPLGVALLLQGAQAPNLGPHLAPAFAAFTNRDPSKLTTLIMTGVTAMCRMTADRMERYGTFYPTLVISDVLRAADITHVSNEVPFIRGCRVNTTPNNLVFCSDYDYWEALVAIGTDIVGLSGNHVNDYGYEGARESLAFYREHKMPIYGSGLNVEEACAPLIIEHHGNKLAFLATLAWNPKEAWATASAPGACYFYEQKERLLETIRRLRQEVDLVLVELQYLETYNPFPTAQQVEEFRELRAAGAQVVTGVQSHVPQAWEPYGVHDPGGPGIILYGLGNLFFDQMWSWETRTGLIARHTIYDGRLLTSEILTTVLEDYAQPRWATPEEREEILRRIHEAAPERSSPE